MKELWDAILKDMLPTVWLRLIAAAIAPMLGAAWAIPNLLEEIGVQIPQQQKPLLIAILLVSAVLLWLFVLLVCVVLQHRSSQQFIEHRGAFLKLKKGGGYHDVVYCGACKSPTATLTSPYKGGEQEPLVCRCGWRSTFVLCEVIPLFQQA